MLASSILHVCVFLVSFGIIKHLKHAGSGNMSIGTLSQTFKNHIHNNKEIQDQYQRENNLAN
jgi:hypothetical protein